MIASAMPSVYHLDTRPARDCPDWVCYATRPGERVWFLASWAPHQDSARQSVRDELRQRGPADFLEPAVLIKKRH